MVARVGHLRSCAFLLVLLTSVPAAALEDFVTFESGQVRPLALSDDGRRLFVVNTPDDRLEIFDLTGDGPVHQESVPVGMEPVAVAARSSREAWVVNHLSDSVSVVAIGPGRSRVTRTLWVGDEPRDIVFAGASRKRAFVTTAHRGQNSPWPRSEYSVPGVGRADVWVFDADDPGGALGGDPVAVLTLFGDKPRALGVSPDGSTVYAAVFRSGNRTTTVTSGVICPGGGDAPPCDVRGVTYPGGLPPPNENAAGVPAPLAGLIVRQDPDSGRWLDELDRDWTAAVRFDLPDLDLFAIDADATPPAQIGAVSGVGTVLYGVAVNPRTGVVYVSNTEARNEVRFEGPGRLASRVKPPGEPPSVRGHLHEARITVVDAGSALPRRLNPHIDYDVVPSPPRSRERSLSLPLGMAVSEDGSTLYLAAMGSDRIGVFATRELETPGLPVRSDAFPLRGGPTGLVLDEPRDRLYALARFENALVVIELPSGREAQRIPLHNPEPPAVVEGRPFLYDADLTSSNGEASCGVCHVFGDVDDLAWDLGNPDASVEPNPNPGAAGTVPDATFHPVKGPMTTQTLRGLRNHGPMHWRGDRTGGNASPPGDPLDEKLAFEAFNVAFESLLGREAPLSDEQMSAFADFALAITSPPNPIRRLDNQLREDEARGREVFFETSTFPGPAEHCQDCHAFDVESGLFGTRGLMNGGFKVPQLRSLYQRVGMFGFPALGLVFGVDPFASRVDHGHQGPQVRGFGYTHDGSVDRVRTFLLQLTFVLSEQQAEDTEAFLMASESDLAPIVGQQVTLSRDSDAAADVRLDLLLQRAATPRSFRGDPTAHECDLVAKGRLEGRPRGFLRMPGGAFRSDRSDEGEWSLEELRAVSRRPGGALTFTCAPPGSGLRMGIDRDRDGSLDADELRQHTDPADAASLRGACRDGIDNDGDGRIDYGEDPGCRTASGRDESPACEDGIDNDGDGWIDHAEDGGCRGRPWWDDEGGRGHPRAGSP